MKKTPMRQLLDGVAWRLRVKRFAGRYQYLLYGVIGGYGLLMLFSRLTGYLPDVWAWWHLIVLAVAAGGVAMLTTGQVKDEDAARRLDELGTADDDLFLATVRLDGSPGAYQDLVSADAERRAEGLSPSKAVVWSWGRPAGAVSLFSIAVIAGMIFLPQLDPFGHQSQRLEIAAEQEKLKEAQQANEIRRKALEAKDIKRATTQPVEVAVAELKKELRKLSPKDQDGKLKKLATHQKQLGELWRDRQKLREQASGDGGRAQAQRFGGGDRESRKAMEEIAREGKIKVFEKQMDELKKLADAARQETDEAKREELAKRIEKKLDELNRAAQEMGVNSPGLQAAMQRALEQAEAAQNIELSEEALEALQDSIDLAQLEAEEIAQIIRDINELEMAMEAIQLARAISVEEIGEAMEGEMLPEDADIAEMVERLAKMNQQGQGDGSIQVIIPGQGQGQAQRQGAGQSDQGKPSDGRGIGSRELGETDEAVSEETVTATLKVEPHILAGKKIMTWTTRGVGDSDEPLEDYAETIQQIKAGVGEAINSEQVPAGYHDSVKRYFDTMDSNE